MISKCVNVLHLNDGDKDADHDLDDDNMLTEGWWRRYPCITSGPKKPLLKSEKVPQVCASLRLKIVLVPILEAPKL